MYNYDDAVESCFGRGGDAYQNTHTRNQEESSMKERMKKRIFALVGIVALLGLLVPATVFSVEDTVTCTVSAQVISLDILDDGTVAYGALALGASTNTTPSGVDDHQHIENDGGVPEDFWIKSSDAIRAGGTLWQLVESTPGHNQFKHEWSSTGGAPWTAMNASNDYSTFLGPVNPGVVVQLDLQITMPATTDDYQVHTITVTVMATEH